MKALFLRNVVVLVVLVSASRALGQTDADGNRTSGLRPQSSLSTTSRRTWMSDNGNGTYTIPIFYEEFSDPDLIRVGDACYLTGTTMHVMPGLPVLHSKCAADSPGTRPDRKDGSCFVWTEQGK